MENYDLVVIGAGPGGYVAAIRAAQLGMTVAIVESRELGGTCLNRGCIPTKTLLHTTKLLDELKHGEELGIHWEGMRCDRLKLYQRKNQVVEQLQRGISGLLSANQISVFQGHAKVMKNKTIEIKLETNTTSIQAGRILIATGSKPIRPAIEGIQGKGIITSDEILATNPPEFNKILIVGGGVIGVEFATIFSALGCEVTIIEAMERILPTFDREISQNLTMILKKRGIKIHTGSTIEKFVEKEGVLCYFNNKNQIELLQVDSVLLAIGRQANTSDLFEEDHAIAKDHRGFIQVDQDFLTSADGIYAIGDVVGGLMLAHLASSQGVYAVEKMAGVQPTIQLKTVPACIYTHPEIACVGLTEEQAKAQSISVKTGKYIMTSMAKSLIEMQNRSFIKLVFENETEVLLGAQLMCERATDFLDSLTGAIVNQQTITQLLAIIRPHPTFSEAITEALLDVEGHAIHSIPRR